MIDVNTCSLRHIAGVAYTHVSDECRVIFRTDRKDEIITREEYLILLQRMGVAREFTGDNKKL